MTRCASTSASPRSTPSPAAAPRSSSAAAPSPNPSRSSATRSRTTRSCSRKSSTCSPPSAATRPSPGTAACGRRSAASACSRATEAGLRTWVGVGGSPQSVLRAARYRMPLMLAIIGGDPLRFRPYVDLYERAFAQAGQPSLPIGVHSPGYIADTDAEAREQLWPCLQDHARPHRRRARLAADAPLRVRRRSRHRLALRRQPGNRRPPHRRDHRRPRPAALLPEIQRRPPVACQPACAASSSTAPK